MTKRTEKTALHLAIMVLSVELQFNWLNADKMGEEEKTTSAVNPTSFLVS